MAILVHDTTTIHYELAGDGPPLLLIAPGGMRSQIGVWKKAPFDPTREFAQSHRVIAMDQRNAGGSKGPIETGMGWDQHTGDQLALLDHLGVDRFLVMGMCIGGAYIAGLIRAAKNRVAGAIMLQPIGFADNRAAFHEMFDAWAEDVRGVHPEADFDAYKHHLFGAANTTEPRHRFLFNASRDEVAEWTTPLLVARGNDLYHPESTSRELASLAGNARLIEDWKQGDAIQAGIQEMRRFLDSVSI
ncbi:MAG: alpha/beta hydrolase [Polyangiaceae bacterium]